MHIGIQHTQMRVAKRDAILKNFSENHFVAKMIPSTLDLAS